MTIKEFKKVLDEYIELLDDCGCTADCLLGAEMMVRYVVNVLSTHKTVEESINEMAQS